LVWGVFRWRYFILGSCTTIHAICDAWAKKLDEI